MKFVYDNQVWGQRRYFDIGFSNRMKEISSPSKSRQSSQRNALRKQLHDRITDHRARKAKDHAARIQYQTVAGCERYPDPQNADGQRPVSINNLSSRAELLEPLFKNRRAKGKLNSMARLASTLIRQSRRTCRLLDASIKLLDALTISFTKATGSNLVTPDEIAELLR